MGAHKKRSSFALYAKLDEMCMTTTTCNNMKNEGLPAFFLNKAQPGSMIQ
jgi:hypothetical protein